MIEYNWNAEIIADCACSVGENPLWSAIEQRLLWTDIPRGQLFRFDPLLNSHRSFYQGRPVGGFTIQQSGSLLLFKDRGTVTCLNSGNELTLIREIPAERDLRFNDVIADPAGRVFCGTYAMGRRGRLYRLDTNGSLTKLLDNIGCSNGMAFSPDQQTLYYTDSFAQTIYQFDYDVCSGAIGNQRAFYTVNEDGVFPDGCTVDAEGYLWAALWGKSCVVRLDPKGRMEALLRVPVQKVTSLAFAGQDLTEIYVTSEGGDKRSAADPLAGALFRFRSLIAGRPEYFSKIEIPA